MKKAYQIKITIMDIEPPIWRRLLIPANITFYKFHKIIQAAFNWQDYHVFNFDFKEFVVHIPDADYEPGELYGVPEKSAKKVKIDEYMENDRSFVYAYDLGDNWNHLIVVENGQEVEDSSPLPICIDGEMQRPPEDIGGIGGYKTFLEAIKDTKHPQYEELLEWAEKDTGGRKFDPEYFYKNEINRAFGKIK